MPLHSDEPQSFLVTGGAGFIGSHLAQYLRAQRPNALVRVLDNLSTGRPSTFDLLKADPQIDLRRGDILHAADLASAVDGIDVVFHQAAIPSVPRSLANPLETDRVSVHGTLMLLEAARRAGVRRVVYAASSSAYGDQPAAIKSEDLLPSPKSPYAVAKLAGEHYMHAYWTCHGLETVSLRYFNVFGPRQDPNSVYSAVIPRFITQMMAGTRPTINGDGSQTRDFTFVENNCQANLAAALAPAGNVAGRMFNVATGDSVSLVQLVSLINAMLGTRIDPIFGPERAGDVRHSCASVQAARGAFGYVPAVNFRDGLQRTVQSYVGAGKVA